MIEPLRIAFLVAATLDQGIDEAREREGWTQIAHTRFVTPDKVDVRIICRASDMHPMADMTPMIKGESYEEGPPPKSPEFMIAGWMRLREEIDRFVETGNGQWVEL